jgi:O-6-methylguanine DNA methyltransferase
MITAFQGKVYKAVLEIPHGETRSYKWVAKEIGRPLAVRAVGQALKKNPFIGVIPCHRVISSDGSLGGFSRGVKAKKKMLRKEKTAYLP